MTISQIENEKLDFAALVDESFKKAASVEGKVIKGTVTAIKGDKVIVDVGLKCEARLLLSDINTYIGHPVAVGDMLDVFVERLEDRRGEPVLSLERAQKEAIWENLLNHMSTGDPVTGIINGKTKGGFTVDISGTPAFLPGSQVDLRSAKDVVPVFDVPLEFKILKMDKLRNNIVVSRRALLEHARDAAKSGIVEKLEEGMVVEGVVRNITEYGAFVDIGGIDGLLHVTDMSWKRISNPAELVKIGDQIKVQILKFNKESCRISLGMKQLTQTPWQNTIEERYKVGEKYKGKVVNITDYGVFVELEDCIEGMIYKTELSWVKNVNPTKIVNLGDEIEVMILEVNAEKHKISLSLKNCQPNPCIEFAEQHPVGSKVKGKIKAIREFGIFISLTEILDGSVAIRDISWDISYDEDLNRGATELDSKTKNYSVGQEVEAIVLTLDPKREIIRLGLKQLTEDPYKESLTSIHKDDIVKGKISKIAPDGMEVVLTNGLPCLIRKNDIGFNSDKKISEYYVGDEIEALVTVVNTDRRFVLLSIKALDAKTQRDVLKKVNSESKKSTLGDVIGDALK